MAFYFPGIGSQFLSELISIRMPFVDTAGVRTDLKVTYRHPYSIHIRPVCDLIRKTAKDLKIEIRVSGGIPIRIARRDVSRRIGGGRLRRHQWIVAVRGWIAGAP